MLIRWLINQSDQELLQLLIDMKNSMSGLLYNAPQHVRSFLAMPCTMESLTNKVTPLLNRMQAVGIEIDYKAYAQLANGGSLEGVLLFLINTLANTFSLDSDAPDAVKLEVLNKFKSTLGGLL